jgi:hypothetical protein
LIYLNSSRRLISGTDTIAANLPLSAVWLATIDGHNWRWIDGLIPMVSIDTFGLIFIHVIDPSVRDFLFFIDIIDSRS